MKKKSSITQTLLCM